LTTATLTGMTTDELKGLEFRLVGPFRGGRVVAVAGDPLDSLVFYFGSTGGGVWKTTDGGVYWDNVSDGYFQRASVGAIAVAASDPNVVYVGMGESTIRGNVSHGDGVYRSTDAGKTWSHLGLAATRHIGKVRIHPTDPNTVYVAALGHAHGPNQERGVFRSRDAGKTWDHVLSRGPDAGAVDLSMDLHNPRVLYAALWEARRNPWSLTSGGPGSGLFRSTDAGDTWTELSKTKTKTKTKTRTHTQNKGFPTGVLGKIGVSAASAQRDRVYVIVEAENGGVLRSDDAGETWDAMSTDGLLRQRAWYYQHIIADPRDAETVWVLNLDAWKSNDGGRTFAEFAVPHGDNHDLWIDPNDTRRMIEGNDGGACVTFNAGSSWQPLGGNVPVVPIHDLVVREPEGDLVIATHGRSFWILDDLGPIRASAAATSANTTGADTTGADVTGADVTGADVTGAPSALLVKPRPVVRYAVNSGFGHGAVKGKNYRMPGAVMVTYRQKTDPRTGEKVDEYLDAAKNPPDGALIHYFLKDGPPGDISLSFLTSDGEKIRTFSSHDPDDDPGEQKAATASKPRVPRISRVAGLNRFVWNLRYPDATRIDNDDAANELVEDGLAGPQVPPGAYTVRLQVGDETFEQGFEVRADPRTGASDADLRAQFEASQRVHRRLSDVHTAVNELRTIRRRAEDWAERASDKTDLGAVEAAARALIERLNPIEAELLQVKAKTRGDALKFPVRLNGKLAALMGSLASADAPPTASSKLVMHELDQRVQAQLDQLSETLATEVAFLNQAIGNAGLAPVGVR
jgi:photosystem II stability/assembly factor-like uncharacterized protein